VVRETSQEINKALATKAVRDKFALTGVAPMDTTTPEKFDAVIQKEVALNAVLAKGAGLGATK
jgi:tripartite-type tricarboxylate transporter receptor subunit TctC